MNHAKVHNQFHRGISHPIHYDLANRNLREISRISDPSLANFKIKIFLYTLSAQFPES